MNSNAPLSEEAGAGFAAANALVESYHGKERSSSQTLMDIGALEKWRVGGVTDIDIQAAGDVLRTFNELAERRSERGLFERQ
jgi:hypothetical protein